jgi:hypothetical protein
MIWAAVIFGLVLGMAAEWRRGRSGGSGGSSGRGAL